MLRRGENKETISIKGRNEGRPRRHSTKYPALLGAAFLLYVLIAISSSYLDVSQNTLVLNGLHSKLYKFKQHKLNTRKKNPASHRQDGSRIEKPSPLPSLKHLVSGTEIKGDVSWMLDFAIIGWPKTGTTTLGKYLKNDEVKTIYREICVQHKKTYEKVDIFAKEHPKDSNVMLGMRCPGDYRRISTYNEHFPKTKLIVGLRHPVKWFQSYYNFRVYYNNIDLPKNSDHLIGACKKKYMGVCTEHAEFHRGLINLGKTSISDAEYNLLAIKDVNKKMMRKIEPSPAKVFIYEISQLSDKNTTRTESFKEDLHHFLKIKNGITHDVSEENNTKNAEGFKEKLINICDPQHAKVRKVLLDNGKISSKWIREYLLSSEDVVVSSRDYFEKLLEEWEHDPCDTPKDKE